MNRLTTYFTTRAGYTSTRELIRRLRFMARTTTVKAGRIVPVTHEETRSLEELLATPRGKAARELCAECPLRLSPVNHLTGTYVHFRNKRTGRVGCFRHDSELLARPDFHEDYEPTPAQRGIVEGAVN